MKGIETETTNDDGNGLNVGWFDKGDWLKYEVEVPMAGDYNLEIRIASEKNGLLKVATNEGELYTFSIQSTGGWQNWETLTSSTSVNLDAGTYTITLENTEGGFNLNWWSLTLVNPADTDKPSKPEIISSESDVHSIALTWTKSTDNTSAIAGYKIYNNNALLAYSQSTKLEKNMLAPNTTFNLDIVASDIAGNTSDTAKITIKTDTIPWELQWSDEFDYTGPIDAEKWLFETGGGGWGNGELQYYTDGNNAKVENGTLIIEARKEQHGSNDFTSSRINSKPEFDFLYGRIEVKAKLPSTKGSWPAIWTLPTNWIYGSWPSCGEIDIMEHSILSGYGYVFGTIHTGAYNHSIDTQKSGGIQLDDVTNTYHTYAIEWYPDHIDWYVDDINIFTFENEYKTTEEWPYDIPHHLLLNIAVGGGLGGDVDYNGTWPQQMIIDYVRVYDFKLDENDDIAPEEPTELTFKPKATSINASWNIAKDNYAIKQYKMFVDNELVDSVNGLSYTFTNLIPMTEYNIGVQACDYSGNISKQVSSTVSTIELTGIAIPGKIEAEDYTNMDGIQLEDCSDVGGGKNVAYIDQGDWLTYTIDVKEDTELRSAFRLAAKSSAGSLTFTDDQENILAEISVPVTGGWQNWETVISDPFTLPLGIQTVKITANSKDFNINWIEIKGKDDFVGIKESDSQSIMVYPNPASTILNINISTNYNNAKISVCNMVGQTIYTQNAINEEKILIDISEFENGIYIIKATIDKQSYNYKIIKQ